MAISQNPLTGRMRGSIGNHTFSTRYGQNIVKTKPLEINDRQSVLQIKQRLRFKNCSKFFKRASNVLASHFHSLAKNMTGWNLFMKLNIEQFNNDPLVTAEIPTANIAKIEVSRGDLDTLNKLTLAALAGTKFSCSVSSIPNETKALPTDTLCIVSFNSTVGTWSKVEFPRGAINTVVQSNIVGAVGNTVHVWALTHSNGVTYASNSVYLGSVALIA